MGSAGGKEGDQHPQMGFTPSQEVFPLGMEGNHSSLMNPSAPSTLTRHSFENSQGRQTVPSATSSSEVV